MAVMDVQACFIDEFVLMSSSLHGAVPETSTTPFARLAASDAYRRTRGLAYRSRVRGRGKTQVIEVTRIHQQARGALHGHL